MDHRGKIWIATSQVSVDGGRFVAFTIANDGPPIPEGDIANLFSAFFTRNKPSGRGLGLAIAQRIVMEHGGSIECEHRLRGAAFRFTLPAVAAALPAARPLPTHSSELAPPSVCIPTPTPQETGTPEFAIVDDSQAFLLGWRTALTGRATPHLFTSPEAFWSAVDADGQLLSRLTAVITDYTFANSRQTGLSFARAVKLKRRALPVFMSSSGRVSRLDTDSAIDLEIDKEEPSWAALLSALDRTSASSLNSS
jgi:hypothetical protein